MRNDDGWAGLFLIQALSLSRLRHQNDSKCDATIRLFIRLSPFFPQGLLRALAFRDKIIGLQTFRHQQRHDMLRTLVADDKIRPFIPRAVCMSNDLYARRLSKGVC